MPRAPLAPKKLKLYLAYGAAVASVGTLALPAVGDQVSNLAGRLAALRGEVEQLSSKLSQEENELRDQLRSLARQKADLKLELQKEQTQLQKTQLAITQKKDLIAEEKEEGEELKPTFEQALGSLRGYVKGSLPFRTGERLAELQKIEDQHKARLLAPERAISRLWTFVEDELRLTRENGMYRQTIVLDGKEELADVVRVGMVMLYFKNSDEVVGYATRSGDAWQYRAVEEPEKRRMILDLFESLKKQIRVGFFELPNALPKGAAK